MVSHTDHRWCQKKKKKKSSCLGSVTTNNYPHSQLFICKMKHFAPIVNKPQYYEGYCEGIQI